MLYYISKYRNSAIYTVLLFFITTIVCLCVGEEVLVLSYYGVIMFPVIAIVILIASCSVHILGIDTSDVNIFEDWIVGIDGTGISYIVFPYLILACSILSYRIICHSNKSSTFGHLLLWHYFHLLSLYSSIILYIWSVSNNTFELMREKNVSQIAMPIIVFVIYAMVWYIRARKLEKNKV